MVLIDTKQQQLSAIVNAYQALGDGDLSKFPDKQHLCGLVDAYQTFGGDQCKAPEKGKDNLPAKDKDMAPEKDKDLSEPKPDLPAPRLEKLPDLPAPRRLDTLPPLTGP